jgi:ABC-type Na+ efflux pump permease subunit
MAALGVVLGVIARIVRIITWILVAVIVLAIVFVVLEANRRNVIVSGVTDIARSLVGPFDRLFTPHDPKLRIAVNWGIAAVVYLLVGLLISALIARLGGMARLSGDRRADT